MRLTIVTLLALLCASPALRGEELNSLSEAEQAAGWELLFDGKSVDKWRNYKQEDVSGGWAVEDGALVRKDNGAGDIITRKQYAAFDLTLEFKISKGGNSGLMFHVTEQEQRPWQTGPEVQIQDNVDGHDPQKAGWLYQLYPASEDACRPAGEWNQLRLVISPERSEIHMNGIRYARFKVGSEDWNRRVANSKFAKFPNFGKAGRGHICLQDHGNLVSFRNVKIRDLENAQPIPDGPTLNVQAVRTFENLKWTGWEPFADGVATPLRPIVITHPNDGSNRMVVATQQGVVHMFPNDPAAKQTKVLLDIQSKVVYKDRQNEEGLLGMAFHPKFKENGHFYIYYTSTEEPQLSVISRFTATGDDHSVASPESEVEIMRIKQPFWNHNGGTVAFGPDGYLYVALGDGGAGNDP
ncbi:MAG: DUF1080 domain-containing protein, partial [Planctomycetales bacterium]|nr:DUF1080 domain-containing protein [Planctomycetales bacterium]